MVMLLQREMTDTTTLIRASDGKVYTSLPPNTESFILEPIVTSYAINHGYDDYTNLGYIQKDTRQFVLLARIQGFFKGEDRQELHMVEEMQEHGMVVHQI